MVEGRELNYAINSSSLQTAISAEDEKNGRTSLEEKNFNSIQGMMQCCSLIYLCIYIIMIVVGGSNIRNCSADIYLPIWMIIYGCIGVAVGFAFIYLGFFALWSFSFIASLIGAARLYSIFTKVQHIDSEGQFYCPQSVYLISFMIATVDLILFSIMVLSYSGFYARSIAHNLMKKSKANFESKLEINKEPLRVQ